VAARGSLSPRSAGTAELGRVLINALAECPLLGRSGEADEQAPLNSVENDPIRSKPRQNPAVQQSPCMLFLSFGAQEALAQ
jgi:hypothetical protein